MPSVDKAGRKQVYTDLKQQWKDSNTLSKVPASLTKLLQAAVDDNS